MWVWYMAATNQLLTPDLVYITNMIVERVVLYTRFPPPRG